MATTEETTSPFATVEQMAGSTVTEEQLLVTDIQQEEEYQRAWDAVEKTLIEWDCKPSLIDDDDEGLVPPSPNVIQQAYQIIKRIQENPKNAPPTRVVPDGNGGLSISRMDGEYYQVLNFYDDGTVEHLEFQDSRLTSSAVVCDPFSANG